MPASCRPRGDPSSAGHGVAAPRACGGATWAGWSPGPPRQPREPQGRRRAGRGRDGLQTLSPGGAAHGASTLGLDTAETLLGGSADQGGGSGFKFFLPSPPDLSNFSPLLGSQLSKAGIPAGDVRQTPRPPRGALSQFGTPQPLRGRLQTTNPVGEDFTNLSIPQPEGSKGDTSQPQILF